MKFVSVAVASFLITCRHVDAFAGLQSTTRKSSFVTLSMSTEAAATVTTEQRQQEQQQDLQQQQQQQQEQEEQPTLTSSLETAVIEQPIEEVEQEIEVSNAPERKELQVAFFTPPVRRTPAAARTLGLRYDDVGVNLVKDDRPGLSSQMTTIGAPVVTKKVLSDQVSGKEAAMSASAKGFHYDNPGVNLVKDDRPGLSSQMATVGAPVVTKKVLSDQVSGKVAEKAAAAKGFNYDNPGVDLVKDDRPGLSSQMATVGAPVVTKKVLSDQVSGKVAEKAASAKGFNYDNPGVDLVKDDRPGLSSQMATVGAPLVTKKVFSDQVSGKVAEKAAQEKGFNYDNPGVDLVKDDRPGLSSQMATVGAPVVTKKVLSDQVSGKVAEKAASEKGFNYDNPGVDLVKDDRPGLSSQMATVGGPIVTKKILSDQVSGKVAEKAASEKGFNYDNPGVDLVKDDRPGLSSQMATVGGPIVTKKVLSDQVSGKVAEKAAAAKGFNYDNPGVNLVKDDRPGLSSQMTTIGAPVVTKQVVSDQVSGKAAEADAEEKGFNYDNPGVDLVKDDRPGLSSQTATVGAPVATKQVVSDQVSGKAAEADAEEKGFNYDNPGVDLVKDDRPGLSSQTATIGAPVATKQVVSDQVSGKAAEEAAEEKGLTYDNPGVDLVKDDRPGLSSQVAQEIPAAASKSSELFKDMRSPVGIRGVNFDNMPEGVHSALYSPANVQAAAAAAKQGLNYDNPGANLLKDDRPNLMGLRNSKTSAQESKQQQQPPLFFLSSKKEQEESKTEPKADDEVLVSDTTTEAPAQQEEAN